MVEKEISDKNVIQGSKDYSRESYREALQLGDDRPAHKTDLGAAKPPGELPIKSVDISAVVKSQILEEEIEQSIEDSPLEVKHIAEDIKTMDIHYDSDVYKHIKTEITSHQLHEAIERGSPERKDIPPAGGRLPSGDDDDIESDGEDLRETGVITPPTTEDSSLLSTTDNIEGDDLEEYEAAKDEHSLSEQLLALASNAPQPVKCLEEQGFESFRSKRGPRGDIDICRKSKDIPFGRPDKKSLKTTKQVSTIEEHSSIESSDSPLELGHSDYGELNKTPTKFPYEIDRPVCSIVLESDTQSPDSGKEQHPEDEELLASLAKGYQPISSSDEQDASSSPKKPSHDSPDSKLFQPRSSSSDKSSKSKDSKKSDSDSEGKKQLCSAPSKKDESFSSSGEMESHYYSAETSDSGKSTHSTPRGSRPCSSEFEANLLSGQGSEYETCVTSQDTTGESGSFATAASSQETSYSTACSSLSHSSRESAYSVDSESSGNLASIEQSSEASETLVPSAQEMELDFGAESEMPVLDEERSPDMKEPYEMDIPESVIRSGIELPFMSNWEIPDPSAMQSGQWSWQFGTEREITDTFEEVIDCGGDITPLVESCADATVSDTDLMSASDVTAHSPHAESSAMYFSDEFPEHKTEADSTIARSEFHPETQDAKHSTRSSLDRSETIEGTSGLTDEEQQSVSSSATHSEHTWHTSSMDTAVHVSGHYPGTSTLQDTQGVVSITDSLSDIPPEMVSSLDVEQSPSTVEQPSSSYLQLNGPVEVDYNPEYDAFEGDDSEVPDENYNANGAFSSNELQFELEGIQADDQFMNGASNGSANVLASAAVPESYSAESSGIQDHPDNSPSVPDSEGGESHCTGLLMEAEQPESQQEHDYEEQIRADNVGLEYQSSHLPESEQCGIESSDSIAQQVPLTEDDESTGFATADLSTSSCGMQRSDSGDKAEIVDTSPEDERYDYQLKKSLQESNMLDDFSDDLAARDNIPRLEIARPELYTHEEEDVELKDSDLFPGSFPDDDKQSTPSFETMPSRRFFSRSGETSAASSLVEFERLEAEINAGRGSQGSTDSLERGARRAVQRSGESSVASSLQEFERLEAEMGAGRSSRASAEYCEKPVAEKSGEHDDISMGSLTDFEKLEKALVETERSEKPDNDPILSEIDERPEGQSSELQKQIEMVDTHIDNRSDDSDYEKRMTEIEEIIKLAETNVERFHEEGIEDISEGVTYEEFTISHNTEESDSQARVRDVDPMELLQESGLIGLGKDEKLLDFSLSEAGGGNDSSSSSSKNGRGDCMISSTDSVDPSSSTATHATYQFETDSVMSSSINSVGQASGGEEGCMVSSTDTLEPEAKITYSQGDLAANNSESLGSIFHESSVTIVSSHEYSSRDREHMEKFLTNLTEDSQQTESRVPADWLHGGSASEAESHIPVELHDPALGDLPCGINLPGSSCCTVQKLLFYMYPSR